MTEISSQTTGATATAVDIGDSFTYNMRLDLPGVDISAKSDLSVEIFGMMPGQGWFQQGLTLAVKQRPLITTNKLDSQSAPNVVISQFYNYQSELTSI